MSGNSPLGVANLDDGDWISADIDRWLDRIDSLTKIQRDQALKQLGATLLNNKTGQAPFVALVGGALVERGGNPDIAIDAILFQLTTAFEEIASAVLHAGTPPQPGEPAAVFLSGSQHMPARPDPANPESVEYLCRAALAMLTRSKAARQRAKAMPHLRQRAWSLAGAHEYAAYLAEVIDVLDDEDVLVLHPEQQLGFRVRISGIADNFQLHTLLADVLIGNPFEGWISGIPVDRRVAKAARDGAATNGTHGETRFDLFQWRALQPDGALPPGLDGSDHWIWGEGIPADIDAFEGTRIVLLGPPSYQRTWNASRRFEALVADICVMNKLSLDDVRDWLCRLAANATT